LAALFCLGRSLPRKGKCQGLAELCLFQSCEQTLVKWMLDGLQEK
jgi:hypothetical protein